MSRFSLSLLLIVLFARPAHAEPASTPQPNNLREVFANQDPLGGKPEQLPSMVIDDSPRCLPPDPKWRLILQADNTCYYYAPFSQRIDGCVVPRNLLASARTSRCGANPWDPQGSAICEPCPSSEGATSAKQAPPPSQIIWPPFQNLSTAIGLLAPRYDVPHQDEGLRAINDILGEMALGRIKEGVPAAGKVVFGQGGPDDSLPRRGRPNWKSGAPAGPNPVSAIHGGPGGLNTWANPPQGVSIPPFLESTPRPVYVQEMPNTCVRACTKMVAETITRKSLPESFLRQISRGNDPSAPTNAPATEAIPLEIPNLLNTLGIPNSGLIGTTIEDVVTATAKGYPAIVSISRSAEAHAIIVDTVAGNPGSRSFFIRDPLNLAFADPMTQDFLRNAGFSNLGVMSEQEFGAAFLGKAVFTAP